VLDLPFQVELVKFTLTRYPGSMSPSSFESELLVHIDGTTRHERVYMNNVLDVKGYRFFQASYDADEEGTILSVNQDVAGRNTTYTGYFLLLIGCIGCLTGKNGRMRSLLKELKVES
jgi:cytochrome c biogenesis protein ResB